ncbi:MAG: hypothetical protein ACRDIC_15270 [bacterium]
MPREINNSQWADIARGIFGIQGGESALKGVLDELRAVAVLQSDRLEWEYNAGSPLLGMFGSTAAGVGNFSAIGLRNPADSGAVLIVEYVNFLGSQVANREVLASIRGRRTAQVYTVLGSTPGINRDSRWDDKTSNAPAGLFIGAQNTTTSFGSQFARFQTITTGQNAYDFGSMRGLCVLSPGADLIFMNAVINELIAGCILWRERPLHKGLRG